MTYWNQRTSFVSQVKTSQRWRFDLCLCLCNTDTCLLCSCVLCVTAGESTALRWWMLWIKNSEWSCRWLVMPERICCYLHINLFKTAKYTSSCLLITTVLLIYYSSSSPDTDILLLLLLSVTSLYTAKRSRRVTSFLQHTVFPQQLLDMARHATFKQYFLVGRAQSKRSEPPSIWH